MMHGTAFLLLLAQAAAPATAAWSLGVFSEASRESLVFRIENPSRFDTAALVPHFFEQTYDPGNVRLGVALGHPVAGHRGELRFSLTPQRTRRADDFDTFFQPDGNVVVTGTTGNASMKSWRVSERIGLGGWHPVAVSMEYSYARHRARFHDGEGITTTTMPPSIARRIVTTRETTVSELHELKWVAGVRRRAGGGSIEIEGAASPVSVGRLRVDLPDKYPGRTLVYYAKATTVEGGAAYELERSRWIARVALRAGRSFSWRSAERLEAAVLSLGVELRRR